MPLQNLCISSLERVVARRRGQTAPPRYLYSIPIASRGARLVPQLPSTRRVGTILLTDTSGRHTIY